MVNAVSKKWVAILSAAVVIWAAVVWIAYRRQILSEEDRQSWERYYLSSATRAILDGSEKFVLLSVDPTPSSMRIDTDAGLKKEKEPPPKNAAAEKDSSEDFHDHLVLGRTEIKAPKRKGSH